MHVRLLDGALEVARSAEAALPGTERAGWSTRLSRARETASAPRYVGAGRCRGQRRGGNWPPGSPGGGSPPDGTANTPVPDHSGRHLGRGAFRRPGPGAARHRLVGIPPRRHSAGSPARRRRRSLVPASRRTAAGSLGPQPAGRPGVVRGRCGPDRRRDRSQPALSGPADPALAARAQVLLAHAAFLAGDLAEEDRQGLLAVELARTAAGREGLVLALNAWSRSAITGAGIQPATVAGLEEAVNVLAAHPDRFAETAMRGLRAELFATLGQLDAAETEVGLCWAAAEAAQSGWWNSSARWPRPASPPPGAKRCRYWRAAPGGRRRAPRRDGHVRSRRPGRPGVPGGHRR